MRYGHFCVFRLSCIWLCYLNICNSLQLSSIVEQRVEFHKLQSVNCIFSNKHSALFIKVKVKCAILHWNVGGVLISLPKTIGGNTTIVCDA